LGDYSKCWCWLPKVDTAGAPKVFELNLKVEIQDDPKAQRLLISGEDPSESIEMIVLDDQAMSVFPGAGCSIFPMESMQGQAPEDSVPDIGEFYKGQAERVETDVDIEGITTDRYELKPENINNLGGDDVSELTDGSVYVAQDDGYLVRIEMMGTIMTAENEFDPNTETQFTMSYTYIPVEDGSLNIAPLPECADQLAGSGAYPVMEGGSELVSIEDMFFYTVAAPLEDVLDFYRTAMVEEGWTLSKDVGGGSVSFATLEFTKDGETVEVSAITSGDEVSVTITKK